MLGQYLFQLKRFLHVHDWQIIFSVTALLLMSSTNTYSVEVESQSLYDFKPLVLTQTDSRYSLASLKYSSGFIPADDGVKLEDAPNSPILWQVSSGLTPDFNLHNRYWLYTNIVNTTDASDWVLHISNFGFQNSKVLIRDNKGQSLHVFDYSNDLKINAIGRAMSVKIEPGQSYLMVVELNANHATWYPYIALMDSEYYQSWDVKVDYAFKLAIGMIIGMILLGIICWMLMAESTFFWAAISSFLLLCYYLEHSSLPAVLWQSSYEKTTFFWVLLSATLMSLIVFAGSFLQINKTSGRWYKVFLGTLLITAILLLISPLLSLKIKFALYGCNYILIWCVILSSGIAKVRSEGRYYIIYILGWLPIVLSIIHVLISMLIPDKNTQEVTISYKIIMVLYIHILHILIHVVALVQRVRVMRKERIQAQQLNQAKSRFMAQNSHDLRQPLHSMHIFLGHLKPYLNNTEANKIFHQLTRTYEQMYDSFSSMMDLSKLEAGVIQPEFERVNIGDLLEKLNQEYMPQAYEKNIQLHVVKSTLMVFSDPVLLERILRNIISNAIKYTDSGRVLIGCRRRGSKVEIQVFDTGCGINEYDEKSIFNIYYRRLDGPTNVSGSGIGLSIVKHLSDLLGHELKLESNVGKGSVFSVVVPKSIIKPKAKKITKKSLQIALVCSDLDLITDIQEALNKWAYKAHVFAFFMDAVQSSLVFNLYIFDDTTLACISMSESEFNTLSKNAVLACVCNSNSTIGQDWISLNKPVLPSQLRSLMNFCERRDHSLIGAA